MDFYILDPAGGELQLPVNPEEVTVQGEKQIETVQIINIGEVDFPTGDKRTGIRFSSFFPAEYDSYCRYQDIPDPQEAINQLINWRLAGKPVRLMITESLINTLVLITRVDYQIRGGEPGDFYFDLAMRTWREVKVRTAAETTATASNVSGANAPRSRPDTKPVPKVYTVKPGDSLWKIAKMQLGSGAKYSDIYNLNKSTIGPNKDLIAAGMKLVMPA